ncbi:MAG: serine/threonine-protein kinase [Gemmatimonadota bacterium]
MSFDVAALQQRLVAAYAGELEIIELLGVGGFAAVFRAHDPVLQRDVAIKVIDASSAPHADKQEEFLREARVVATVEDPHIVPLYAAEVRHGLLCLTMRLVPGQSLAERITRDGPLPAADAAQIAREVAQALASAHAHGVVHRDIKPENILLDGQGHAIVTDFGISLVTGRASERTTGMVIGTPQYLSPEQALGEEVDGRADIYSLGVVLYEMLVGRLPFESPTTAGMLAKQILETPPPLHRLRADIPDPLVALTTRALSKARNERPDAETLVRELTAASTPEALLSPALVRRRKRWRRARRIALAVVVLVAALGLAVWAGYWGAMTFTGGRLPALSATRDNVPPALIAEAQADGTLLPGEVVEYAFIPGNLSWKEAMLVTNRGIIRRTPTGARRFDIWLHEGNSLTSFRRGSARGFIVIDHPGAVPDTIYSALSGGELGALSSAIGVIADAHRTTPATAPAPAAPAPRTP